MVQTGKTTPSCRKTALLRQRQGALLVAGILVTAAGFVFFCHIMAVTTVSFPVIGLLLCATGPLQLLVGCQIKGHVPFALLALATAFYMVFGLLALTEPSSRFAALSLIFFTGIIATGAVRSSCGYLLQFAGRGWRWLVAGGSITMAIGCFLIVRWPFNDLALAGRLLAFDLAAYGITLIGFSLHLGRVACGEKSTPRAR